MAPQYDFTPGFDLSSVTNPTRQQVIQAISQLGPLSNIGGIVAQAGANANASIPQGTLGSPSITDNPRFARYIWLNEFGDTPIPYFYDSATAAWVSTTVAPGSIGNNEVAANAAIAVSKLAVGTARYLVRTNTAGTAVEYVSPPGALNDGELPVAKLTPNGVNGYLKTITGVATWVSDATERAAIVSGLTGIAPPAIQPGANQTLLGTDITGAVKFDTPGNLLANGSIGLVLLNQGGAATGDILYWNGTAWVKFTPAIDLLNGVAISTGGVLSTAGGTGDLTNNIHVIPHGLGAVRPKQVRVVAVNLSTDLGYAAGDEVELYSFRNTGSNNGCTAFCSDTVNITALLAAVTLEIPNKATAVYAGVDETKWRVKAYAWK